VSIYRESARHYDALYRQLFDHGAAASALRQHIAHLNPVAVCLVEAACGTGLILEQLAPEFRVAGFDLSPDMIALARHRLPGAPLFVADMTTWSAHERYDAIVCVGGSIRYVQTEDLLRQTVRRFADHLTLGGVLLIEPWFPPAVWEDGRQTLNTVDEPELKIVRLLTSSRDGERSVLDIEFLIGREARVERFAERHVMGLFTDDQMRAAFVEASLTVDWDVDYPTGRGLYVGQRRSGDPINPVE